MKAARRPTGCEHRPPQMDVRECVLSAGRAVLDVVEREWQPLSPGELEQRLDQAVEEILEADLMAPHKARPPPASGVQLLPSRASAEPQVLPTETCFSPPEEEDYITDLLQNSESRARMAGRARLSLSHTVQLSLTLLSERKGNIHRIFFSFCERLNMLQEKQIRWPVGGFDLSVVCRTRSSKVSLGSWECWDTRASRIRLPIGKHDVESTVPEVKRMKKEAHPDSWLNLQLACDRKGRFLHCRTGRGLRHGQRQAGYPLTAQILTPYSRSIGPREELFNEMLEEHFHILDQAVANLKARFKRLRYLDIGNYERARAVVLTTCVLHNMFLDLGQVVQGDIEKEEATTREGELEMDDEGVRRRDTISDLLFKMFESGSV
uniref:DDE Tnp4 domain-containing protein n=1 Tax=Cyclopterus lumpus TaxID=8103 RepID=A0A8C3AVX1_CYCLU